MARVYRWIDFIFLVRHSRAGDAAGRFEKREINLLRFLAVLFLILPVLEIYLLIKVGSIIGAGYTILLVVGAAAAGVYLLRTQGFATFFRVRQSLARGELPAFELLEGAILLASGALLLAPGLFTDILGLLGVIPLVRQYVARWILSQFVVGSVASARTRSEPKRTLEGEYRRDE